MGNEIINSINLTGNTEADGWFPQICDGVLCDGVISICDDICHNVCDCVAMICAEICTGVCTGICDEVW